MSLILCQYFFRSHQIPPPKKQTNQNFVLTCELEMVNGAYPITISFSLFPISYSLSPSNQPILYNQRPCNFIMQTLLFLVEKTHHITKSDRSSTDNFG